MLGSLEHYLIDNWNWLPTSRPRPRRLAFLGQATGVSKAVFFVFADADPVPGLVVKAPRLRADTAEFMREVNILEQLRANLPERLCATLPGPMHVVHLAGEPLVIEPVLAGRPLDSLHVQSTSSGQAIVATTMELARRWLAEIQREAPHRNVPLDLRTVREYLLRPLEQARCNSDLTSAEERYLGCLAEMALSLEGKVLPLCLYHGDFREGNILIRNGQISVLDWQFSRMLAAPMLDWFSFVFRLYSRMIGLPDIDGDLGVYRAAFAAVFNENDWFGKLVAEHTRAYCAELGIDTAYLPLLQGLFIVDNINKFQSFLSQRALRGYLYLLRGAPTSELPYQAQIRRQAYVYLLGDLAERQGFPGDTVTR